MVRLARRVVLAVLVLGGAPAAVGGLVLVLVLLDGASMVLLPRGKRSYLDTILRRLPCSLGLMQLALTIDGAGVRSPERRTAAAGSAHVRGRRARGVWGWGVEIRGVGLGGERERERGTWWTGGEREVRGGGW